MGGNEYHQRSHLDVESLDLLAQIFRGAAYHQSCEENRDHCIHQHAIQAGTDTAENHFAQLDLRQRHQPAQRREGIVHGVHRTTGSTCGDGGEQRGVDDAEARLLAFHIAAGLCDGSVLIHAQGGKGGVALLFRIFSHGEETDEQNGHGHEDGPALTRITHHAAEGVAQRRRNQEHRYHCQKIGERCGIFERMRRVGVKETATVSAQLLDRFLRSHRTQSDDLLFSGCLLGDRVACSIFQRIAIGIHLRVIVGDRFLL